AGCLRAAAATESAQPARSRRAPRGPAAASRAARGFGPVPRCGSLGRATSECKEGTGMPSAAANGIEIAYEVIGRPQDRPLLLVMGLGTQMIHWDDELCAMLAERGHRVIRFDNRDIGLSSKMVDRKAPNVMAAFAARARGAAIDA